MYPLYVYLCVHVFDVCLQVPVHMCAHANEGQ